MVSSDHALDEDTNLGKFEATLNLVFLGTGEHRTTHPHILTALADEVKVDSKNSVYVIDGPGGIPKDNKDHPMLGTYKASPTYNKDTGDIKPNKTLKKNFLKRTFELTAKSYGKGDTDASLEAMKVVEAMLQAGKIPLRINASGFSRGAVNAIRFANALNAKYGKGTVLVNLLLFDPVPGEFRRKPLKSRMIPGIVRNCTTILMKHEARFGFEAQDKKRIKVADPTYTKLDYRIYHGVHTTATCFRADPKTTNPTTDEAIQIDPAILAWDDTLKFCDKNGINLENKTIPYLFRVSGDDKIGYEPKKFYPVQMEKNTFLLSDEERLSYYTKLIENQSDYKTFGINAAKSFMFEKTKLGLVSTRTLTVNKTDYFLHGTNYFLDRNHLKIFQNLYPAFFDYYFQKNKEGYSYSQVQAERAQMDPKLRLQITRNNERKTAIPEGIPVIAFTNKTVTGFYEDPELINLWTLAQDAANPVIVENDRSVKKQKAIDFLRAIQNILAADIPKNDKINAIRKHFQTTAKEEQKGSFKDILSGKSPSEIALDTLNIFIDKEKWKPIKDLKEGKLISNELIENLKRLSELGANTKDVQRILTMTLRTSNRLRDGKDESRLERILRKTIFKLSYDSLRDEAPKDETLDKDIAEIINIHKNFLKKILLQKFPPSTSNQTEQIFVQAPIDDAPFNLTKTPDLLPKLETEIEPLSAKKEPSDLQTFPNETEKVSDAINDPQFLSSETYNELSTNSGATHVDGAIEFTSDQCIPLIQQIFDPKNNNKYAGWTISNKIQTQDKAFYRRVTDTNNNPQFLIHPHKLTTVKDHVDVFRAMLKSYQAIHGTKEPPLITTHNEEAKALWVNALNKEYPNNKFNLELIIQIPSNETPKEKETGEEQTKFAIK